MAEKFAVEERRAFNPKNVETTIQFICKVRDGYSNLTSADILVEMIR